MEFRDLKRQYSILQTDIELAIQKVNLSGAFINGPAVSELENQLAEYIGVKHCITCANGTDALTLALKIWNIGHGDAVFVPDFTFFSSAETIAAEGATPIFVDVEKESYNIDTKNLEETIRLTIEQKQLIPRAIVAVDLFGRPANYKEIRRIAKQYGLFILEDGAQGFGGALRFDDDWQRACSFGDISTTSFFPAKPLGCYGDGGAIFTDNDDWASLAQSYRIHGKGKSKYDNERIGMNSRLDTIQAAILQVKLEAFIEYELENINQAAAYYTQHLQDFVFVPQIPDDTLSSWAQYTIQLRNEEERNKLQKSLASKGIPSMIYYPKTMHQQTAFNYLDTAQITNCPVSEILTKTVLSLPIHPYIKKEEMDMVISEIINIVNQ